ncbi:type IV secretory system conjugative DNA transfer family protein [Natronomonas salina]|uniref:TraM recognition domain-containing protein n=1 Tax=Natronomonas salina TaxID=1710540 RepID=UPI0015B5CBCB|nr:TraM recognition domain-containing protein [Natronomonas salina]QLD91242.1 type IV secretory system conjugative DNA transfer family protein [Natronomonas salina]
MFERFMGTAASSSSSPTEESTEATPPAHCGDNYDISVQDTISIGEAPIITETEQEGTVAGPQVREMFEAAGEASQPPLWIGYDADTHRGFREAPIQFDALFRHLWITGATGYGKSTTLLNMMVQWAYAGYGFVYIDPKARDSRDLLRMLPRHRLDDVVWIEPGSTEHDRTIGLNFLELPECETRTARENEIENRIENLKAIFDTDEYWGVNMESITESMARAMMQSETPFSVIDMYFTLLNADRREDFARDVEDPYVREFCLEIAAMDDETVRPLLKRIKTWVENAVIRRIIAHRESTIDFSDIVANDRIVIVSTPVENTDIKKMVTLGVLRNLWSAIQQRSYEQEPPLDPYFVLCDEFDEIASENLDVESMLARARSMRLSVTLATQYPSQLAEPTRKAMLNNCDTLVTFSVNDVDDARLLMKRFRGYNAEDLISTDQYQVWTKLPLADGRYSDPVLLNTFPVYPPLRSADAVHDVIEQSLERYGTDPLTDADILQNLVYSDANEAVSVESLLAEAMAEAIRAVQLREGVRETNGWVDTPDVDAELMTRIEAFDTDVSATDVDPVDLPDVREASPLIEVDLDRERDTVVTRLSEDGNAAVTPATGDVQSAGGDDHDALLTDAERALTEQGFSVRLHEQDGRTQPDGTAVHPDYDTAFTIEAETTTPDRPAKVLRNLARAHHADRMPIFVVRPGDDATKWAARIENICSPPLRELADGSEQFYTCDEVVTFGGGATVQGGVTAVRPRTGDSNRTVWQRDDGDLVLSDGDTEFTRVPDVDSLSKDTVPAYYSYDRETERYTVYTPGETQQYESRDTFEDDWVSIKRPFLPSEQLPDRDYDLDSYLIVILPEDGSPLLYQNGSTYPFSECLDQGVLWPSDGDSSVPKRDAAEATDGTDAESVEEAPDQDTGQPVVDEQDSDAVEVFAAMYVRESEAAQILEDELFQAYLAWLEDTDIEGTTDKGWFTRKLGNVVDFEVDRVRDDGDRVRSYNGIDLTPDGHSLHDT